MMASLLKLRGLLLITLMGSFLYACEAKVSVSGGTEVKTTTETPAAVTSTKGPTEEAAKHYNSGVEKAKAGDIEGAITEYKEAIRISPDFAEAYNNSGAEKAKLKDYKGAIVDLNEAIRLTPENGDPYYTRGLAKAQSDDLQGAKADLEKAGELFKKSGMAEKASAATAVIEKIEKLPK
ncbi:tetratricopeptide repeat protein [Pseudanabaena sp. UWO311]|jgi:tetratricopeptide (TPR) repeat protein|uniref:tetratricopeptide repeat protein n=1 Tax=Pseudanabaena sp. UWO311 TaxID=2487337 RepID=UPI001158418E|nr:tetratricopeptide repeat protein [Pseudanabaena sp. UWO311]TYQ24751.1 tetratricopeptide repeat protein [Pseudanabaena sp. UWO311]